MGGRTAVALCTPPTPSGRAGRCLRGRAARAGLEEWGPRGAPGDLQPEAGPVESGSPSLAGGACRPANIWKPVWFLLKPKFKVNILKTDFFFI